MTPYMGPPQFVDFQQAIADFLYGPLAIPLYVLIGLAAANFGIVTWDAWRAKAWDRRKAPQVLRTLVNEKVLPLTALGALSFLVGGWAGSLFLILYALWAIVCLVGEAAQFRELAVVRSPVGDPVRRPA